MPLRGCSSWSNTEFELQSGPHGALARVQRVGRFVSCNASLGGCAATHVLPGRSTSYGLTITTICVAGTSPPLRGRQCIGSTRTAVRPGWSATTYPSRRPTTESFGKLKSGTNPTTSRPAESTAQARGHVSRSPARTSRVRGLTRTTRTRAAARSMATVSSAAAGSWSGGGNGSAGACGSSASRAPAPRVTPGRSAQPAAAAARHTVAARPERVNGKVTCQDSGECCHLTPKFSCEPPKREGSRGRGAVQPRRSCPVTRQLQSLVRRHAHITRTTGSMAPAKGRYAGIQASRPSCPDRRGSPESGTRHVRRRRSRWPASHWAHRPTRGSRRGGATGQLPP